MTEGSDGLLPPLGRDALRTIVASARTYSGRLHTIQKIVERTLQEFGILVAGGLTLTEICALLAENGILGKDGRPIPKSSLTSAVCRAKKRASPAASGCIGLQLASANSGPLRAAADGCDRLQLAAADDAPLRETSAILDLT
ncbi:MAG TPA: hypothetical protein VIU82_26165 [Bosea sp. (in: a-proteobacteria)]